LMLVIISKAQSTWTSLGPFLPFTSYCLFVSNLMVLNLICIL
jgi:hypothetical protein